MTRPNWLVLGLIALAAGVGLNLWRPLYLAPPYVEATGFLYGALGLAWVVPLLAAVYSRPAGTRAPAVLWLLVTAALLGSLLAFCAVPLPIGAFAAPLTCWKVGGTVPLRYQCWADRMFYADRYTFESVDGLPLVRLVLHETVDK